ncbi:MAG: LacI family transcriptional regulator [Anaerolineales bacterium]|nr:MAG: LacI family transcriptional regulator [Anaerolineales bacterium]
MTTKNRPPTIGDVAQRAKVSIATVSRVLNGKVPVAPDKADRVRAAIEELQFVPRTAARVLASRKTGTVGLVLPEISGAFFSPMLRGVEAGIRQAGYDFLIHSMQTTHEGIPHRQLGEHNTDGLIVFTGSLDIKELTRLNRINFPIVLLHQTPPESLNIPVITIENKSGAEMLVDHLIEGHGRRRIVYLQGPEGHEDSVWRERGYRESLEAHGITFDPELVATGGFDDEEAFATIQELILEGVEFDAVFAGDDDAAMGVMRALKLAGRLVPDDVSVVGFDDIPFARYVSPPLTTIHAPIEEVGREAVSQLMRLINGQQPEALTLMRTELVLRESCGCESGEIKPASPMDP